MKKLKKCARLFLALTMVLAMVPAAAAAEITGSITINGTTAGKVYEIYKIFDLTMASSTAVAYTIDEDWAEFFAGDGAEYIADTNTGSLNPITVEGETRYINITESNVAEFSQAALAYAAGKTADMTQSALGDVLIFQELSLGYYLVYPQGASQVKEEYSCICSLTSTVPDAEVVVKAEYPAIEKTDDAVSADLGQTVTYTITGEIPDTTGFQTYEYTIRDTMTDGLTFQKNVTVHFGQELIGVNPDYETADNGFVLTFDMTKWQNYVGQPITVTYTAVVNENAIEVGTVEKNSATLIYSHDPGDSTKKTTNPPIEEEVYSSQIVIDKVDGENGAKLAGAEFVLLNAQEQYYKLENGVVSWMDSQEAATVVVTDDNGVAGFQGLKNGIYDLKEIKAPDGYNLLTKTVEVRVNDADASEVSVSVTSVVENNSGTTLPSTGGMGTTLLYAAGGLLVLVSMVLLVTKKRMRT